MRSHLIAAIRARFALPAWRSRDGSVAVVVALLLVVLIGFVALGTEVVALLMTSRQMQSAADSAALAAATARAEGYPTAVANEAVAIARDRGFVNGATSPATTVAVSSPPTTGAYVGNPAAVQVVITQLQPLLLTALFHNSAYTLTARAVGLGTPCLLSLDASASDGALLADHGASVVVNKCGIASNSSSTSAIQAKGNGNIAASWLNVVGNTSATNGGIITVSGLTRTGAPPVANPYAGLAVPTPGTCLSGGVIDNQTIALPAGTYCAPDGINITRASNVTLNGVYILKDSSLVVKASSLSGTATIVLAGTGAGVSIGNVTISNGSTLNLTAPATGPTAGMVFFQDIRAPATGGNSTSDFGIQANTLNGAVYFPNTTVKYSSGSSTASVCTLLIARQVAFFQSTTIKLNCSALGMGRVLARLVE